MHHTASVVSVYAGLLLLFSGSTGAQEEDPEKLVALRTSWNEAKERDSRPIRKAYLDKLIKLREELTRQEKLESATLVAEEITDLTSSTTLQTAPPSEEERTSNPQLEALRSQYWQALSGMLRKNDQIYLKALENLKSHYAKSGDLSAALAVKNEISKVASPSEEAVVESAPSSTDEDLPRTNRQLEAYLLYTDWTVVDLGGKSKGLIKFRKDGKMTMPWNDCNWEVSGKRSADMIHSRRHWTHQIEFSEDMKTFEVTIYGNHSWNGTFSRRLTEEEIEKEAAKN